MFRIDKHATLKKVPAWKNRLFYFQNADLHTVMQKLSDWHDADDVYQRNGKEELFSGQIDKSLTLCRLLQGPQQPGVTFILNNNLITVVRK